MTRPSPQAKPQRNPLPGNDSHEKRSHRKKDQVASKRTYSRTQRTTDNGRDGLSRKRRIHASGFCLWIFADGPSQVRDSSKLGRKLRSSAWSVADGPARGGSKAMWLWRSRSDEVDKLLSQGDWQHEPSARRAIDAKGWPPWKNGDLSANARWRADSFEEDVVYHSSHGRAHPISSGGPPTVLTGQNKQSRRQVF